MYFKRMIPEQVVSEEAGSVESVTISGLSAVRISRGDSLSITCAYKLPVVMAINKMY